jgi:hypothetical protein
MVESDILYQNSTFWVCKAKKGYEVYEDGVAHANRLFSSYQIAHDTKLWIVTEANRSATTVLCPDEC